MHAVTQALYDRLAGDATLDALLARTVIEPGTGPAVYTTMRVPPTAALPYVVIAGDTSNEPDDAFDAQYRDLQRDIHCYAERPDQGGGSVAVVEQIAKRVLDLLHRQHAALSISGFRCLVSEVRGPIQNDGDTAFGRVLMARLHLGVQAA